MGIIFDGGTLTGGSLGTLASPKDDTILALTFPPATQPTIYHLPWGVTLNEGVAVDWSQGSFSWAAYFLGPDTSNRTPEDSGYVLTLISGPGGEQEGFYGLSAVGYEEGPANYAFAGLILDMDAYNTSAASARAAMVAAKAIFDKSKSWVALSYLASYPVVIDNATIQRNVDIQYEIKWLNKAYNADW